MGRAHDFVSDAQKSNPHEDQCSPQAAEEAFALLDGRWKLVILYHLFDKGTLRFSDLERAIPKVSQRMLSQQLRALERDGIILRTIYPEIPPRVEYELTRFGKSSRPALHALLDWAAQKSTSD